jgi:hypothetical protein
VHRSDETEADCSEVNPAERQRAREGYERTCRTVLGFFDADLKGEAGAEAALGRLARGEGVAPSAIGLVIREASRHRPGPSSWPSR